MATCREIEPLITAVTDAEATPAQQTAVSEHLRECAPCRARAADEEAGRRILRECAAGLHVEAPPQLRARCQPKRATPLFAWPLAVRRIPVWVTAVLVVAMLTGGFVVSGHGSRVLAAELTLDHLKCFSLFETASGPGDAAVVAQRMKASYGWSLAVPATSAALGLRLVGGRRCFSTDGRVAHILYRHLGHPLSLFVVPSSDRAAEHLAVMGHHAIIWSRHHTTYVVLADESSETLGPVSAYMRRVIDAGP